MVISAYREAGIRVVFSPMVWDVPPIAMVRHKDSLPADVQEMLGTKARPIREQLDYLEHQFKRHPAGGTLHWAVAPFAPQRCTPKMLQGCAELAHKHDLAVYTHVYETRGQVLIARELFADHDGSLISYLDNIGLLGPRLNIVHSVWISRAEMERMAAADAGIVLNHLSNLKLKSGIAPVCDLRESGVRLGLGCDNCSGSDVQSVFQAMKMFCLFAAVSEPEPGPALAHEVLRHATLGNARTAGLAGSPRRHPAGLQGRPDPYRSQRRRLSSLQQRGAAARLHRGRPRRGERDRRRPRGDQGAQGEDHRRGRLAPRGRRSHAALHRRL